MDVNVALAVLRVRAVTVQQKGTGEAGRDLAKTVLELDEWLSRGGRLPDAWGAQP